MGDTAQKTQKTQGFATVSKLSSEDTIKSEKSKSGKNTGFRGVSGVTTAMRDYANTASKDHTLTTVIFNATNKKDSVINKSGKNMEKLAKVAELLKIKHACISPTDNSCEGFSTFNLSRPS